MDSLVTPPTTAIKTTLAKIQFFLIGASMIFLGKSCRSVNFRKNHGETIENRRCDRDALVWNVFSRKPQRGIGDYGACGDRDNSSFQSINQ